MKHSRFPLLSLTLLLFGCSSGDTSGAPPPALDQTPPLDTQTPPLNPNAPPLNPNAPPCNGSLAPADSLPLLADAFCTQVETCAAAGTPVEGLDELCSIFATCAANPAASDCGDVTLPTLPICGAELSACLTAYFAQLGCRPSEQLPIAQVPACSRVAAAAGQTGGTDVNVPDAGDIAVFDAG